MYGEVFVRGLCPGSCIPCLWEVIIGSIQATLCLFACSRPCNLCLQYVNLFPLVYCSQCFHHVADWQPGINCLTLGLCMYRCLFVFFTSVFVSSLLSCSLQEEDFREMLRTTKLMETQYGHLFEKVIVNDDLTTAFSELRLALKKVEMETHWVPVSWTHS